MRWYRMYSEVMHDPKVQRLPAELFRFWVNCMCMAAENEGNLPSITDIAWMLRKGERAIASQVAALYDADLLDREGDTFSPHNWALRQYRSDTSTDRVKRFRNKKETFQKRFSNGDETVSETDQNRTEQIQNRAEPPIAPQGGGLALAPNPPKSKPHKAGKRTAEEIKKALGPERLRWWEGFWSVYPCRQAMNPAMDTYERKVHEYDLAAAIYRGAKRYADQIAQKRLTDPSTPVKYAQGWLKDERWTDEISPPLLAENGTGPKVVVDRVAIALQKSLQERRKDLVR